LLPSLFKFKQLGNGNMTRKWEKEETKCGRVYQISGGGSFLHSNSFTTLHSTSHKKLKLFLNIQHTHTNTCILITRIMLIISHPAAIPNFLYFKITSCCAVVAPNGESSQISPYDNKREV
jgi:hypothetical protein